MRGNVKSQNGSEMSLFFRLMYYVELVSVKVKKKNQVVLPVDRFNVLGWAKDGSGQRGALVGDGVQVVEDHLLAVLLDLLHLAENHSALTLDLLEKCGKINFGALFFLF